MELINRLEQLTNYWVTYLSSEFPCNISKFDPAHFLFDWIRLAYCLTVSGIVHKRMNYFNVGVQFLVVIKSKNVQQYDSFIKYLVSYRYYLRFIFYKCCLGYILVCVETL